MSLRARHWVESKHRRNRIGEFASKTGGAGGAKPPSWMDRVASDMERARPSRPSRPARTAVRRTPDHAAPLTDRQFEARAEMVTKAVGAAIKTHATDRTQVTESGRWKPERDRLHHEIADELYARAAHVPNRRKAVVAGGLGGAGKTTVLKGHAGIDPNDYLTLNPDDVKELMAERGLIPEVPGHSLSPMERAALVHEESSRITSLVADKALRDGKNMMWDITMSSKSSVVKRIDALKAAGYKDINGVFVDIPVEVSVERAMSRYRRGADKFRAGKGPGGRFVPPAIIRAQRTSSGETINRGVFEDIRDQFSNWSMYDNSVTGRAPQLITKKGR